MSKLRKKTSKGVAWMGGGTSARMLLQLIFMAFLARFLSPEEYGVQAIAMVVVSFASLITDAGLGKALIQKSEISDEQISTVFYSSIALGVGSALGVGLFAGLIADFFDERMLEEVVPIIALIFVLKSFSVVPESLAIRNMNFKPIALRNIVSYFLSYAGIAIPMAYLGFGVWSLVIPVLAQEAIKSIMLLSLVRHSKNINLFSINALKPLVGFGGGVTVSGIFNKLAINVDSILVGKFLGTDALGVYGRGYKLMQLPAGLFGTVISSTLLPAFSSIQKDKVRLARIQYRMLSLTALALMPLSCLIFFISDDAVLILLGAGWDRVGVILQWMSLAIYFRVSYKICGEILKSLGYISNLVLAQMVYTAFVVIACIIGKGFGLQGVALGVTGAIGLHSLVMLGFSARASGLSLALLLKAHILPAFVMTLCFIALKGISISRIYLDSDILIRLALMLFGFVSVLIPFGFVFRERLEINWLLRKNT